MQLHGLAVVEEVLEVEEVEDVLEVTPGVVEEVLEVEEVFSQGQAVVVALVDEVGPAGVVEEVVELVA